MNDFFGDDISLEDIKVEQLEGDLKGLSGKKLEAKLKEKKAERDQIQKQVAELTKKRNSFIEVESKKAGENKAKDSFDAKITEILKEQLK